MSSTCFARCGSALLTQRPHCPCCAQSKGLFINAPGVLANDERVKGRDGRGRSDLTVQLLSGASDGSLLLNPDGSFQYTPAADFLGADSFTYVANDGVASTDPVVVVLTVSEGDS